MASGAGVRSVIVGGVVSTPSAYAIVTSVSAGVVVGSLELGSARYWM